MPKYRIRRATAGDTETVRLRVATANDAAVRLYEKLGMRGVMCEMYKRL